ncbi:hypothetical protein ACM26W_17435 [Halomonas sp. HK25]|uniref:hypothetical protein n=1 Tax=Halomonas sp. HK25 TaxID=3394321 RepID=UPI0039FC9DFC
MITLDTKTSNTERFLITWSRPFARLLKTLDLGVLVLGQKVRFFADWRDRLGAISSLCETSDHGWEIGSAGRMAP